LVGQGKECASKGKPGAAKMKWLHFKNQYKPTVHQELLYRLLAFGQSVFKAFNLPFEAHSFP
jgi:hypothetical protein